MRAVAPCLLLLVIIQLVGATWTKLSITRGQYPQARSLHTMTSVGPDQFVVFGGDRSNDLWAFQSPSSKWENLQVQDAPAARSGHSAVLQSTTDRSRLIIFGGESPAWIGSTFHSDFYAIDVTERGIPVGARFVRLTPRSSTTVAVVLDGRTGHCAVVLHKINRMLIIGGKDSTRTFGDVFEVDLGYVGNVIFVAKSVSAGYQARSYASCALVEDSVYVYGGFDANGRATNSLQVFDTVSKQWTQGPSSSTSSAKHASTVIGARVYIYGGTDGFKDMDALRCFDTVSQMWMKISSSGVAQLPGPVQGASAITVNDQMYLFGGAKSVDVFVFNPAMQAPLQPRPVSIDTVELQRRLEESTTAEPVLAERRGSFEKDARTFNAVVRKADEASTERLLLLEQLNKFLQQDKTLRADISDANTQLQSVQNDLQQDAQLEVTAKSSLSQVSAEVTRLQAAIEVAREKFNEQQQELASAQQDLDKRLLDIKSLTDSETSARKTYERLVQVTVPSLEATLREGRGKLNKVSLLLDPMDEQLESLKTNMQKRKVADKDADTEITSLQQKFSALQRDLKRITPKLKQLQALRSELQTFSAGENPIETAQMMADLEKQLANLGKLQSSTASGLGKRIANAMMALEDDPVDRDDLPVHTDTPDYDLNQAAEVRRIQEEQLRKLEEQRQDAIASLDGKISALIVKETELRKEMTQHTDRIVELEASRVSLADQLRVMESQVSALQMDKPRLTTEKAALEQSLNQVQADLATAHSKAETAHAELRLAQDALAKEQQQTQELRNIVQQKQSKLNVKQDEVVALEASLHSQLSGIGTRLDSLENIRAKMQVNLQRGNSAMTTLSEKLDALNRMQLSVQEVLKKLSSKDNE